MRSAFTFIATLIFLLQACSQPYDKPFYERISAIKIPENASVIETFDNGRFVTVTSFKLTHQDVMELMKKYNFIAADSSYVPGFMGNTFLKGPKPMNSDLHKCFMKIDRKGITTCLYVLDTSKQILWAEINYAAWEAN